jgi:hypothetical protein
MDKSNNKKEEIEFTFEEGPGEFQTEVEAGEFVSPTGEFVESTTELVDKTEVIIFTNNYYIHGKIALVPGARLTDYIVSANLFVAVTDVEVRDKAGNLILTTPFLDVHRDHIEIILPAELATIGETDS